MSGLTLRVTSGETWTTSSLTASPEESIASVKVRVLAADKVPASQAWEYEVKHGGALVRDESRSLAALGVKSGAGLIVLPRRRRPVR